MVSADLGLFSNSLLCSMSQLSLRHQLPCDTPVLANVPRLSTFVLKKMEPIFPLCLSPDIQTFPSWSGRPPWSGQVATR